jgi:cell division protein FtsB
MNFKKIVPYLKNKYIIATAVLVLILVFFEDTNVYRLYLYKTELNNMRQENDLKEQEIEHIKIKTTELTTDPVALEIFARETYKMKKNDEVVFLFVKDTLDN